ncbi:uncharacterized protein NECHADRAFT_101902 [Fusarium vanettenii 77-13-4]|uniref:2-oxoadipate dioxygenase/decarboxylase n=1 Tax=Fusarium vanettenii (strain ATCC MYA-4622 / CBS 123669 / FGSC 9596 / NRRL 45880 / 77-13-4) TaxID=660122 RepID=C7Z1T1_FUSV7|nr:uncharacterized protein NECHADRAFT_101902 [Fusarium vanettenii 77-13-4]EEU41878.1 hypothetical protein NECHADRAFT_101902 [Fusarium vanettenii 77-13-4]
MTAKDTATPDAIRALFSSALSHMYQREVPQYGTLLKLVSDINRQKDVDIQHRIEVERHGAIRLGTPEELATMRRLFSVMGMHPVGYYDLTVASLPVHATCFRPLTKEALAYNPFRVFTSLLRLELIQDESLRQQATEILSKRNIFTPRCIELIEMFEAEGALSEAAAREFIKEALETFRWHKTSTVDMKTYKALRSTHPLIADVVCFKGPHINHLTPRVLDIETAQIEMKRYGLDAKEAIEGPPPRTCPILLRQTSFLALDEAIAFSEGAETGGSHKARFGEIEQRGVALTPKGRRLYDDLINEWRQKSFDVSPETREEILAKVFARFPDDTKSLRDQDLAYFTYKLTDSVSKVSSTDMDELIDSGAVQLEPITYEDFLPVSAAGIFHSNLGDDGGMDHVAAADQATFEKGLGCKVNKEFELYRKMQEASIEECFANLQWEVQGICHVTKH